jgi:hypothetical protein
MRRREFITLIGGTVIAWPLAAHAQQAALPVVGYLNYVSPESDASRLTGLRRGLNETGYVEGRNFVIEYRWAGNQADRLLICFSLQWPSRQLCQVNRAAGRRQLVFLDRDDGLHFDAPTLWRLNPCGPNGKAYLSAVPKTLFVHAHLNGEPRRAAQVPQGADVRAPQPASMRLQHFPRMPATRASRVLNEPR